MTNDQRWVEWQQHRGIIQRLYVTEDKSLPNVVLEMKQKYNFVATERQYKRRISDWGLDKNVKDEEMRSIIEVEAMRLRQGKQSAFYVRDRRVDRKKIDRFAHRKGIDRSALHNLDCTLPSNVRCTTPPPAVLNSVSEQVGRRTSYRQLTDGRTLQVQGCKRVHDLEDNGDILITPLNRNNFGEQRDGDSTVLSNHKRVRKSHRTPLESGVKEKLKSSAHLEELEHGYFDPGAQLLSTGTNSTIRSVPMQLPLIPPEDTIAPAVTQSGWKHDSSRNTASETPAGVKIRTSQTPSAAESTATALRHPSTHWPGSHTSAVELTEASEVDQTDWRNIYEIGAPLAQRPPFSELHKWHLDDVLEHFGGYYSEPSSQQRKEDADRPLSIAVSHAPIFPSDDHTIPSASELVAPSMPSSQTMPRFSSRSSSPEHSRLISLESTICERQSEKQRKATSKLTIGDLLQAALTEQLSDQRNDTKINRTLSDVYQDELFDPTISTCAPSLQGDLLSSQENNVFAKTFQAAQSGHITARSAPPPTTSARERSPFVPSSPYSI
ncbi:MAG: hypothetical protein Q9172_005639 [Xanthocarpia lactea]